LKKYGNNIWKRNQKNLSRILLKAKQFIIYSLFSVMSYVKLSFMINNFEKSEEVNNIEFLFTIEKVLKKHGKLIF